jgi:hypothetical protein
MKCNPLRYRRTTPLWDNFRERQIEAIDPTFVLLLSSGFRAILLPTGASSRRGVQHFCRIYGEKNEKLN